MPGKRSGPFMQRMDHDRPDAGDLRRLKRCENGVASQCCAHPFALPGLVNGQPAALSAAACIGSLLRPGGGHQRGPAAPHARGWPTPWPGVGQGRRAGRPSTRGPGWDSVKRACLFPPLGVASARTASVVQYVRQHVVLRCQHAGAKERRRAYARRDPERHSHSACGRRCRTDGGVGGTCLAVEADHHSVRGLS